MIEDVRRARPNSIQSPQQVAMVEEMALTLAKYATALPRSDLMVACRTRAGTGVGDTEHRGLPLHKLLAYQREFLPNEVG